MICKTKLNIVIWPLALFMTIGFFALAGCQENIPVSNGGQAEAEETIRKSIEEMTDITGFYARSEVWYGRDDESESSTVSESYVSLPDKRHVVFSAGPVTGFQSDTIMEAWYLGEKKYIRLGDGRVKEAENDLYSNFIELELLNNVFDLMILPSEEIDNKECYVIEGKVYDPQKDPEDGYHNIVFYIDIEEYLIRKLILELEPVRKQGEEADERLRRWSETIYQDYNAEFEITKPTLTE